MNLKHKITLVIFVIGLSFSSINISAANFTDDSSTYTEFDSLCQMNEYDFETTYESTELIFLDTESSVVLFAALNFDGTYPFIIPTGTNNVTIVEYELDENNNPVENTEVRTDITLSDCSLTLDDDIVYPDAYEYNSPKSTISYDGSFLTFDTSNLADTDEALYQFIGENGSEKITSNEGIDVTDIEIVQYSETIGDKQYFYEIYLNSDSSSFYIKQVDDFEIKDLSVSVINYKYVAITVIMFILFVLFQIGHRKKKKQYNILRSKEKRNKKRRG